MTHTGHCISIRSPTVRLGLRMHARVHASITPVPHPTAPRRACRARRHTEPPPSRLRAAHSCLRRHLRSKRSASHTDWPCERACLSDDGARLLGLPESLWCRAACRTLSADACAHGSALTLDRHAHACASAAVPAAVAATLEQLHVAKVGLNSTLASTSLVSMPIATLLATEARRSTSARALREELGT